MINKIIEFCARNKFIVLLIVGMATLGGWYSMRNITLDANRNASKPAVVIEIKGGKKVYNTTIAP